MQSEPGVRQCGLFTRLLRVRPLAAFALCALAGALTAQRYSLPLIALCATAGGLLLLWLALKLMGGKRLTAIIAAAGVFLGAAALTWRQDARPILENRYGVEFSGVMGGTMQVDEDEGRLVCVLSDVEVYGEKLGRDVRLYLRGDPGELRELEVGQRIAATGHIWGAKKATNPWQFDFGAYLWRSGLAGYATANMEDAAFSPAEASFGRMIWFIRRAKQYYEMPEAEIYTLIIPVLYRLRQEDIRALVTSESEEQFAAALSRTFYGKQYENLAPDNLEDMYGYVLRDVLRQEAKKKPYSAATLYRYLYLKEHEGEKLIAAVECVRYGIDPDEAFKYINAV